MDGKLMFDAVLTVINLIFLICIMAAVFTICFRVLWKGGRDREILSTFSAEDYAKNKAVLDEAQIPNTVKTTYTGRSSQNRSMLGRVGENPKVMTQYQIFVPKKRYEEAVYQLNRVRTERAD